MVGIKIKFNSFHQDCIKELLGNIDLRGKSIDVQHWETNGIPTFLDELDVKPSSSSDEIIHAIFHSEIPLYPEFAELFFRNNSDMASEIDTYEDFVQSKYYISFVIYDQRNIEICSKNEKILSNIISTLHRNDSRDYQLNVLERINLNSSLRAWRSIDQSSIDECEVKHKNQ